jgi:hypothetical protein
MAIDHPLDFIAGLDGKPMHIVLFYEDEEYARQIEHSFLRNGLTRSQTCIYTTHGDGDNDDVERIRIEMINHGIDVNKFESSGLLHIMKICDPRNDPSGFEIGMENLKKRILEGKKPPIRLVSRSIRTVENEADAKANMLMERIVHSSFLNKFPGMLMCPYPIDKVPSQIEAEWFLNHMQHHHAVVFAPKAFEGSGLVLDRY